MKKSILIFLFFFLFSQNHFSANYILSTKKDTTKREKKVFSVAGGFIYTSLNFLKNYQEETYSRGYSGRLMLLFNDHFRMAATVEQVQAVNIPPIWFNVKNTFYDLDAHFVMHFADKRSLAYFILGTAAQYWEGYYAGQHDLNAWRLNAKPHNTYKALYFGATMGFGAETKIIGPLSIYGEFRFRFSKTDVGTGLNDVLYSGGLKLNLPHLKSGNKRHSFLHFRDKYHWF